MQMIPRFIFLLILLHAICPQWSLSLCLSDISSWMKFKIGDITELLTIGFQFRPTLQFPPVALNDASVILPSKYARNIDVTFDHVLNCGGSPMEWHLLHWYSIGKRIPIPLIRLVFHWRNASHYKDLEYL